jgi:hypothetical protein
MRCYSPEGTRLWEYQFDNGKGKFIGASGAVIGDLNMDNFPEVVFTTYSVEQNVSNLIVLDNKGGQLHKLLLAKRGSMSPPCLADIDGDHKVEIIISLKDVLGGGAGGVQIWDVASASDNLLPWPTGRGNNLRNGQSTQPQKNESVFRNRNQKLLSFEENAGFEMFNLQGQKIDSRNVASLNKNLRKQSNTSISSGIYFYKKTGKNLNKLVQDFLLLK